MSEDREGERVVREQARTRAAELAASYRDAGWEALVLQPANVVPIPVGPDAGETRPPEADVGISFLLPTAEFALLTELADADPETEIVRGGRGDHAAVVVTLQDRDSGAALVIPLSYHRPNAGAMARAARERDRLALLARPADVEDEVQIPLDPAAVLGDEPA
jgi:hypothetical protein